MQAAPPTGHDIYARQGFGRDFELQGPFGLLLVDFVNGFADPDVIGGGNIPSAITQTEPLFERQRNRGIAGASSERIDRPQDCAIGLLRHFSRGLADATRRQDIARFRVHNKRVRAGQRRRCHVARIQAPGGFGLCRRPCGRPTRRQPL
jgi:hypothetical protein